MYCNDDYEFISEPIRNLKTRLNFPFHESILEIRNDISFQFKSRNLEVAANKSHRKNSTF